MPNTIRPIRIENNIAFVPLLNGREAMVDVIDADLVSQWNWSAKVDLKKTGI